MNRLRVFAAFIVAIVVVGALVACTSTPAGTTASDTPPAEVTAISSAQPTATNTALPTITPSPVPTQKPQPSPTPGLPPQVLASNPIDGDLTMQLDRPLILVFDQPMDQAIIADSLSISPSAEVTFAWPAPDRVTITANEGWTADAYDVILNEGMASISGVKMTAPFQFSFEVGGHGVPVPILMYHNIKDLDNEPDVSQSQFDWTVRDTDFQQQMYYLRDNGWHTVSPKMLIAYFAGESLPPKPVIIAIDDAWVSLLTRAWPVFLETGLRPIAYVVAEFATYGTETDYLVWDQLRDLVAQGLWIGSHSYGHVSLYELPAEELHHEVFDSRQEIEQQLGVTLDSFCYPFGAYDDTAVDEVQAAGFTSAVTLNPVGYQDPTEPFRLNRLRIAYQTTMEEFIEMLNGRLGRLIYVKRGS
ncbi:MAG: polysaccharide deacetylase family protein [Anaerolineae bacterium]